MTKEKEGIIVSYEAHLLIQGADKTSREMKTVNAVVFVPGIDMSDVKRAYRDTGNVQFKERAEIFAAFEDAPTLADIFGKVAEGLDDLKELFVEAGHYVINTTYTVTGYQ